MKRFLFILVLIIPALFTVSCPEEGDAKEQTSAPTVNIESGVLPYCGSYVTLRCSTKDAEIYYTLDGRDPAKNGTLYSNTVRISEASTLRAIAKMEGLADSEELKASYTIFNSELTDYARSMRIGWNLGNTMDGHSSRNPSETAWQPTVTTQALMDGLAEQGFGLVRIPVTWLNKIGPAPDYTIDSAWLNRVAEIAGYVRDAGMKAMINIHHDGADSNYWLSVRRDALESPKKDEIDARFTAVWSQIAQKFINEDHYLMFEAFNELHDGNWGYPNSGTHGGVLVTTTNEDITKQYARVNELNKLFVDTVRLTGGKNSNRYLVLPCLVTRPSMAQQLVLPEDTADNRLIVTVHFYDPYDFTGSGTQKVWGQNAIRGHWGNEANVRRQFDNLKTWFTGINIPIIMGEYGAVHIVGQEAYRKYYMEYVTKYAVDSGIIPVYWDNNGFHSNPDNVNSNPGEKFGLIDRVTGKPRNEKHAEVLAVMMKAAYENYSYHDIAAPQVP